MVRPVQVEKNMQSINAWRRATSALVMIVSLVAFLPGCGADNKGAGSFGVDTDRPVERFEYDSPEQVEELAISLNYTPEAWQAGIREVPRLYITTVPPRWRDKTADGMPVVDKK